MSFSFKHFCVCPNCAQAIEENTEYLVCSSCGKNYPIQNGIPILLNHENDQKLREYIECYDQIAEDDLQKPIVSDMQKEIVHGGLLKFIGDVSNKRVLDIGSSQGLYLQRMKAEFRVALDITRNYLEKIPKEPGVACLCADAEHLPIVPGFFDVIIISDILEHILNPPALVACLRRVAGPHTRIIVHIPWEESLDQYAAMDYKYTHLRNFTSYDIFSLFYDFRLCKRQFSVPMLKYPIFMTLEPYMPVPLFNWLRRRYFFHQTRSANEFERRCRWQRELPKREWWLRHIYKPTFRMLEFRY